MGQQELRGTEPGCAGIFWIHRSSSLDLLGSLFDALRGQMHRSCTDRRNCGAAEERKDGSMEHLSFNAIEDCETFESFQKILRILFSRPTLGGMDRDAIDVDFTRRRICAQILGMSKSNGSARSVLGQYVPS